MPMIHGTPVVIVGDPPVTLAFATRFTLSALIWSKISPVVRTCNVQPDGVPPAPPVDPVRLSNRHWLLESELNWHTMAKVQVDIFWKSIVVCAAPVVRYALAPPA